MQDIEQGLGVCVIDPHLTLVEYLLGRMIQGEDDTTKPTSLPDSGETEA